MQTNRLVKHLIVVDYDCSVLNNLGWKYKLLKKSMEYHFLRKK